MAWGLSLVFVYSERAREEYIGYIFQCASVLTLLTCCFFLFPSFLSFFHIMWQFYCDVIFTHWKCTILSTWEAKARGHCKPETSLICIASPRPASAAQCEPTSNKQTKLHIQWWSISVSLCRHQCSVPLTFGSTLRAVYFQGDPMGCGDEDRLPAWGFLLSLCWFGARPVSGLTALRTELFVACSTVECEASYRQN